LKFFSGVYPGPPLIRGRVHEEGMREGIGTGKEGERERVVKEYCSKVGGGLLS
jgi:hypothetical protein